MAVDFSESANALISDVLAGHLDRNNLAVEVENGTSSKWDVDYYTDHGDISAFGGNSRLHPVDPSGNNVKPTIFEVGMEAAGAGCNIGLVLTSSNKTKVRGDRRDSLQQDELHQAL